MSIDIVPELQQILERIKGELDKEPGSSSDKIVEILGSELSPLFEEYSRMKQRNEELKSNQSRIKDDCESVLSRLFEVLSDIMLESSQRKDDDFDKYIEELRKFTKPLGMKIYCYKDGESIPKEDLPTLDLNYQQTNDSNLNEKAFSTERIGFRINDLDMKYAAKVVVYSYKDSCDVVDNDDVAKFEKYLQRAIIAKQDKECADKVHKDILSKVKPYFSKISKNTNIDSESILNLCISFIEAYPNERMGKIAFLVGSYYEDQNEIEKAVKFYKIAKSRGYKRAKTKLKKLIERENV